MIHAPTTTCSALIIYLLSGSWVPLLVSITRYTSLCRQSEFIRSWKYGFVYPAFTFQSFIICGLVLSVLYSGPHFGSDATCNDHRMLVIFYPFRLTTTVRVTAMALLGLVPLGLSVFVTSQPSLPHPVFLNRNIYGTCTLLFLMISLWITNVELLRIYNRPQSGEQSWVAFGQVRCPMSSHCIG
jgi:hypothetical protein